MALGMQADPPTTAERGNLTTTLARDQNAANEEQVDQRQLRYARGHGVQVRSMSDIGMREPATTTERSRQRSTKGSSGRARVAYPTMTKGRLTLRQRKAESV